MEPSYWITVFAVFITTFVWPAVSPRAVVMAPEFRFDSFIRAGFTNLNSPALASNGSGYLVAWRDGALQSSTNHLYAVLFPADPINHIAQEVDLGASLDRGVPILSANSHDYLVGWVQPNDHASVSALVTGSGAVSNQVTIPSPANTAIAAVALGWDDRQYLVSFVTVAQEAYGVYVSSDGPSLSFGTPFRLLSEAPVQAVAVASIGQVQALVVGRDSGAPAGRIVGQFISSQAPILESVTRTMDRVLLSWAGEAGRTYQVQFRNGLQNPAWSNLQPVVRLTNGIGIASDSFSGTTPLRFYRVTLQP